MGCRGVALAWYRGQFGDEFGDEFGDTENSGREKFGEGTKFGEPKQNSGRQNQIREQQINSGSKKQIRRGKSKLGERIHNSETTQKIRDHTDDLGQRQTGVGQDPHKA